MEDRKALTVLRTGEAALGDYFPLIHPQGQQDLTRMYQGDLLREITIQDLPRLQPAPGGLPHFVIAGDTNNEPIRLLSGIIMAERSARLLWDQNVRKGSIPRCTSKDAFWGVGDPGGDCLQCPMAQFGSDPKGGKGQACKHIRQILLLRENEILPCLIAVPPTSLKNSKQYFLRLLSSRTPPWSVVSTLTLERATNDRGDNYGKINFTKGPLLSDEEKALMRPYAMAMANFLRPIDLTMEDYAVVDGQEGEQPDTPHE